MLSFNNLTIKTNYEALILLVLINLFFSSTLV